MNKEAPKIGASKIKSYLSQLAVTNIQILLEFI